VAIFLSTPDGPVLRCASPGYRLESVGTQPSAAPVLDDRFPLHTTRDVIGVLAVQYLDRSQRPDQRHLLQAFASQTAVALERARLLDQAYQMDLLQARERLYTALLNSISHDLRTPLASITGVLSALREKPVTLSADGQRDLLDTAWGETKRLNRLVGNLLDMSRLEAGALTIQRESYEVQDLIGVALAELGERLGDHPLTVDVVDDLPMVPLDLLLMLQVLANLLDNAVKYSPPGSPVEIRARECAGSLEIAVADRGVGIPDTELSQVFDKFFRGTRSHDSGGTGLGLSISKGIVEAHGGHLRAEARAGGGTRVCITLPLDNQPPQSEAAVQAI
jgi:two-component system sensor histidine kinase KdpD